LPMFPETVNLKQCNGLSNASFVHSSAEGDAKNANVRRENKLYSYQEQMADLELRKVFSLLSLKL